MDNHTDISYEQNWKDAAYPVRVEKHEDVTPEQAPIIKKKTRTGKPLLTIIQIVLCLLIVLSAFIIKTFGGDIYKNIKSIYETEIKNEIILNPYKNSLDKLFNAYKD